jgi:hypothetical protein
MGALKAGQPRNLGTDPRGSSGDGDCLSVECHVEVSPFRQAADARPDAGRPKACSM